MGSHEPSWRNKQKERKWLPGEDFRRVLDPISVGTEHGVLCSMHSRGAGLPQHMKKTKNDSGRIRARSPSDCMLWKERTTNSVTCDAHDRMCYRLSEWWLKNASVLPLWNVRSADNISDIDGAYLRAQSFKVSTCKTSGNEDVASSYVINDSKRSAILHNWAHMELRQTLEQMHNVYVGEWEVSAKRICLKTGTKWAIAKAYVSEGFRAWIPDNNPRM